MFDSSQVQCQPLAVVHVSPCLCQEVLIDNCKKFDRSGYLKGGDLQGSDCNLVQVCDVVWPAGVPRR